MSSDAYDPKTYNQIAQEYAKAAISAALLMNGGALVALMSQLGKLHELRVLDQFFISAYLWIAGMMLAGATCIFAFGSARLVAERKIEQSNLPLSIGFFCVTLSFMTFGIGALYVIFCLAGLPAPAVR